MAKLETKTLVTTRTVRTANTLLVSRSAVTGEFGSGKYVLKTPAGGVAEAARTAMRECQPTPVPKRA